MEGPSTASPVRHGYRNVTIIRKCLKYFVAKRSSLQAHVIEKQKGDDQFVCATGAKTDCGDCNIHVSGSVSAISALKVTYYMLIYTLQLLGYWVKMDWFCGSIFSMT